MRKITLLILMLFVLIGIKAQTSMPGGANATAGLGLELWLSADKLDGDTPLPADGSNASRWADRGGKYAYQQNGTDPLPILKYDGLNYHPTLDFPNMAFAGKYKLVSDKDFLWDTTTKKYAYYMFMVSSMNNRKLTETQVVFAMGSGFPYATIGWRDTGRPGTYTDPNGTNWHTADVLKDRLSGIVSGIHPNVIANATSPLRRQIHYNGIGTYTTTAIAGLTAAAPRKSLIGSNAIGSAEAFSGDVQEVIVMTADQGETIDPMDLKKVHSYLALKYGQTLVAPNGAFMGVDSYVNSLGANVWTFSENAGYNNDIFGIGRDDASGLYQKQSKSADNNALTAFVGNLEKLNRDNTATLDDRFYLIFGSNTTGAAKLASASTPSGTSFKNKVLGKAFTASTISTKKWRTQLSGAASFTLNMKMAAAENGHILVSKDGLFVPAETNIYAIDENGIAQGVVVENGDYIALAGSPAGPAGVGVDLRLWLRADDLTSMDMTGTDVTAWKDQSLTKNDYTAAAVTGLGATQKPVVFKENAARMNFFPALYFNGDAALAVAGNATSNPRPMSVQKPENYTVFIVRNKANIVRGYTFITSFGGTEPRTPSMTKPGIGYLPSSGAARHHDQGGPITGPLGNGPATGITAIQSIYTYYPSVTSERFYINDFSGASSKHKNTSWGNGHAMASGGVIGGGYSTEGRYEGDIAEIIFYEKKLEPEESERLKTYLAIKYGVTLDNVQQVNPGGEVTVNRNYRAADNKLIWEGSAAPYATYHNNIAGLMRDDATKIFLNKSKSSNEGNQMTVVMKGHKDELQGTTPLLKDGTTLVWGNSAATGETPLAEEVCSPAEFKMNRTWMFSKSDNTTAIDVDIQMVYDANMFPIGLDENDVYIFMADSEDKITNDNWDSATPGFVKDGVYHFPAKFVKEKTFITFGYNKKANVTCPAADFEGVKTLKFNDAAHRWPFGGSTITANLGDAFTVDVSITGEPNVSFNHNYPMYYYSGVIYHRTGLGAVTTEMKLSGPAYTSFEVYSLDQYLKSTDEIEIYGECGGTKVFPKLSYKAAKATNSTYTILGQGKAVGTKQYQGYAIPNSTMVVEFNNPVDKIVIVQNTIGTKALQYGGISEVKFSTPVAPPAPVDGTAFSKSAPVSASACEPIPLEWTISNYNCDVNVVSFSDLVKAGMSWIEGSVSVSGIEEGTEVTIADYVGSQDLKISGISIPSFGKVTIKAQVLADYDVTVGSFGSAATVTYNSIVEVGATETLTSCDRGSEECKETVTTVVGVNKLKPLVSTSSAAVNYREEQVVPVEVTIQNPNTTELNGILRISYNEEFTVDVASITSETLTINAADIIVDPLIAGQITINNVKITNSEAAHVIKMNLKAPVVGNLAEGLEGVGTVADLKIEHRFDSTDPEPCTAIAFRNASNDIYVPYKECIVYIYNIAIDTESGNRAFNEIRTSNDKLEFKFTKTGTDKPVRVDDVLTIEIPKYLEVGAINIVSTDIPDAAGVVTPESNELVAGTAVRKLTFKLPAAAINASPKAGQDLSFTYALAIEYKRVEGDQELVDVAEYPVKAQVMSQSDCEVDPISAGRGENGLAFLTANKNAYWDAVVNDALTLEIINPGFEGKWYADNGDGTFTELTTVTDFKLAFTPTVSSNTYVYVEAIFDGKVYGKVPVRIIAEPNLVFDLVPNMPVLCEDDKANLSTYVTKDHVNTKLEYFYDAAMKLPIAEADVLSMTVTKTTEFYVRAVVGADASSPKTITVEVNAKTRIETNTPRDLRVSDTGTISLSVVASGTNLTYQWYKDGAVIDGATSATYTNANSTPANDGEYHVVVTGTCGTETSEKTTVKVDPSLEFTAISHPVAECANENPFSMDIATLVSGVKKDVTLVYYTDANATQVLANTNVSISETTTYYVRAFFADKKSEIQKITINITPSTVIVAQTEAPAGGIMYVGHQGVIGLSATATGSNLTHQWYKDGVAIVENAKLPKYTVPSATPEHNGVYHVVVTGDCGVLESKPVTVKVDPSLEFTAVSPDPLCDDEIVNLTTLTSGEAPGVTFKYYSNPELTDELTGTALSVTVAGNSTYYVKSFDGRNNSDKAQVINITGIATSKITPQPVVVLTISNGDAIELSVVATGSNVKYQWYKGAELLAGETSDKLVVLNSKVANSGDYNVKITGDCGEDAIDVATVTVNPSLDFTVANPAPICPEDLPVDIATLVSGLGQGITVKYYADRAGTEELTSPSVTPSVTTTYYVISSDGLKTSAPQMITVEVRIATAITTKLLSSYRVSDGGTISLSVVAKGENLTYQWYKDGAVIAGATSATYTNANSTPANDGVYHVVVTGDCGVATSVKTTVKVDPSLLFTVNNNPGSICPSVAVELKDLVTGIATGVTVKYYQDANATIELASTSVTPTETTSYYVRGTYLDNESDIATIRVDVTPATAVVLAPSSTTVGYGGAVVLYAEASGSNVTYQWLKDGVEIAGATSATYEKLDASPADNGIYSVVMKGDCGNDITLDATVKVDASLTFTVTNPKPICIGTDLDLNTLITGIIGKDDGVVVKFYSDAAASAELPSATITASADVTYYVRSVDADGNVSVDIQPIVIVVKPDVAVEALSEIKIDENNAITLEAKATGLNLTYQWYKGDVAIEGETRKVLEVVNAKVADSGTYKVVVGGDCKQAEASAVVTVYPSLDFTITPLADAICPADVVDLSALVSVVPTGVTVKYYADRAGVEELPTPSVAPGVTTTYYVIASNGLSTSPAQMIVVGVNTATAITTNLVATTGVSNGGSINLAVIAEGVNLTYQWYKDGAAIAGATSATYTKVAATPAENGVYHVVVTGTCGIVTSVKTTVTVDPSLEFTASNYGQAVCPSTSIDLTTLVSGVAAGVTVQYYQDADATILLPNTTVAPTETTTYYVQASHANGVSPVQSMRVDVTPATVIVTDPASISVSFAGAVVLRVEATGSSNLTYQWYKGGVAIDGETRAEYEKLNATPADNGSYTVIVTGECGVETSKEATVKVDPSLTFTVTDSEPICIGTELDLNTLVTGIDGAANGVIVEFFLDGAATSPLTSAKVTPATTTDYYVRSTDGVNASETQKVTVNVKPDVVIVKALTNIEIVETEAIHFEVEATGLNLTYQWFKNGVEIAGETRNVLEVLNATKADEGTYKVVVTGDCKTVESEATVTVDDGLAIRVTNPSPICAGASVNLLDHVSLVNNPTNSATIKFYSDAAATIEVGAVVSPSATTTYYVQATDALVSTPVMQIVVTVNNQATATIASDVNVVCAGTEANLTLTLTGTAPWTVVYTDGAKDYTLTNIANTTHTFGVVVAKATTYTLKSVVDALGCPNASLTGSAKVDVYAGAIITEQPTPQVFCLGNDFVLTVKATNAVSYQWYKDGVVLAGETSSILEVLNATAGDIGVYHVEAIGECASVESNKVQIDGNILDIIVQKWNNTLVANNNSSTNGGYNFVAYKWYRDGELIGEGPYHTVGNDPNAILVMGAAYHLEVTTDDGRVMITCPYYPVMKDQLSILVYPTVAKPGEGVNLEIRNGGKAFEAGEMDVYTVSGMHVKSLDVKEHLVPLNLPYRSDVYLVKVKLDGFTQTFKVIVK